MASFAEELSKLLDPVADSHDPEDDIYEETKAKLIDTDDLDHFDDPTPDLQKSSRHATQLLEKMNETYRGKTVSRKCLSSESEHEDIEEELDSEKMNSSEDDQDDDANSEIDSVDEEYTGAGMDEEIDSDEAGDDDLAIFKAPAEASQHQKRKATLNQLKLWELMLESRIKCQETLTLSNRLPRHDTFDSFSEQVKSNLSETDDVFESVLLKLMDLRRKLMLQSSMTKKIADSESWSRKRKGTPLDEIDECAEQQSKALRGVRNKVLKLWYDKTRLTASGKASSKSFENFERTPVSQILDVLLDKERLVKRTQSKRSQYRTLGVEVSESSKDQETDVPAPKSTLLEIDTEVFDDDDFYHQLLRQLIEQKSMGSIGSSDPQALSRLNLKIQSLRSKAKKNVDTKASKGRKIRYGVHSKLQSFMAPNDQSTVTHESRNEIFKSLFRAFYENSPDQ